MLPSHPRVLAGAISKISILLTGLENKYGIKKVQKTIDFV